MDHEKAKQRLRNVDPYEFEEFVAEVWELQDWKTSVSQASNDQGVDVVAEKNDGMVNQRLAIQVKRYSAGNKVGRGEIQKYHSMKVQDSSADAAVVVTTGKFTSQAEDWANEHNVKLIDGDDLVNILEENAPEGTELLDEYAPTLNTTTTASTGPATSGVMEGGVEEVDLPSVLEDDQKRRYLGIGGVLLGLILIADPFATQAPIATVGALVAVGAGAVYVAPETVWDVVTPTRIVHQKYGNGGEVVEYSDSVAYEPPGERDVIEYEGTDTDARRRAAVFAKLDQQFTPLPQTSKGTLPTEIASSGQETVAVYRYAVHNEEPASIASDMNMTQQEIVDELAAHV